MTRRVAVLGGGVSGLTLSWYLRRAARGVGRLVANRGSGGGGGDDADEASELEVVLIEGGQRLGGWIRSDTDQGHVFERGPRGFRPNGTGVQVLRLIEELGMAEEALMPEDDAKHRFLFVDGELQKMPSSIADMAFRMPSVLRSAIKGVLQEPSKPRGLWADESIHGFISRRFGTHVAEKIVSGMVSGIYAGDTRSLSLRACFPRLWQLEHEHGSIVKGLVFPGKKKVKGGDGHSPSGDDIEDPTKGVVCTDSNFVREYSKASQVSFSGGMEQLTITLEKHLSEDKCVEILKGDPVSEIITLNNDGDKKIGEAREGHARAIVRTSSGKCIECDEVFSTLPAEGLRAALLPSLKQHSSEESCDEEHTRMAQKVCDLIEDIQSVDVGVVNLAFDRVPEKMAEIRGFGYLVPASEDEHILGVSFDSCIFPSQDTVRVSSKDAFRVCVMIGGVHGADVSTMSEGELTEEAKNALVRHIGISKSDLDSIVASKAGVMHKCIPQYNVGHNALVRNMEQALHNAQKKNSKIPLTILGNSFYGVGIADCVSQAWRIAQDFSRKSYNLQHK